MKTKLFFTICLAFIFSSKIFAQTAGTLTFSFTQPLPPVGSYTAPAYSSPTNADFLVAWIEKTDGTFVKTKLYYNGPTSSPKKDHLPDWASKAGCGLTGTAPNQYYNAADVACNKTDATTGATLSTTSTPQSFGSTISFTWNGTDTTGAIVPDGDYVIRIESAWGNVSRQHSVSWPFTITKGATANTSLVSTTNDYFTNVAASWSPTLATSEVAGKNGVRVYPNPVLDSFKLQGVDNVKAVKVYDVSGKVVRALPNSDSFNISGLQPGTYFIEVNADGKTFFQKVVKK